MNQSIGSNKNVFLLEIQQIDQYPKLTNLINFAIKIGNFYSAKMTELEGHAIKTINDIEYISPEVKCLIIETKIIANKAKKLASEAFNACNDEVNISQDCLLLEKYIKSAKYIQVIINMNDAYIKYLEKYFITNEAEKNYKLVDSTMIILDEITSRKEFLEAKKCEIELMMFEPNLVESIDKIKYLEKIIAPHLIEEKDETISLVMDKYITDLSNGIENIKHMITAAEDAVKLATKNIHLAIELARKFEAEKIVKTTEIELLSKNENIEEYHRNKIAIDAIKNKVESIEKLYFEFQVKKKLQEKLDKSNSCYLL